MRVLFQRVARAIVSVDDERIAEIGRGALLFVCVMSGDCPETIRGLAGKVAHLRVFNDEHGKLNRSLLDVGGEVLLVSQFTLAADTGRGHRPGFSQAAPARVPPDLDPHLSHARHHAQSSLGRSQLTEQHDRVEALFERLHLGQETRHGA